MCDLKYGILAMGAWRGSIEIGVDARQNAWRGVYESGVVVKCECARKIFQGGFIKALKRILMIIMFMPFLLIALVIAFEIFGMIVNHTATAIQTRKLVKLAEAANGTEVVDVYSETGNTGPTGNHVDMLTILIVRTEGDMAFLEEQLKDYAGMDEYHFKIQPVAEIKEIRRDFDYLDPFYNQLKIPEDDEGCYMIYCIGSAPFSDNIEGH